MKKPLFPIIVASFLSAASSQAVVFMIDFGPTAPSGSLTNSPYHSVGGSSSLTTWNQIGASDTTVPDASSGLFYADGTVATGVGVNLGVGIGVTTIDLATQPNRALALGNAQNNGVYTGNSVGKDGIFYGSNGAQNNLGVQITGLAAGIYDVYVVSRNTNTSEGHTMANYAGAGAAGGNFDYSGYASQSIAYPATGNSNTSSWASGTNYTKFTVTIAAGEAINIASDPSTTAEDRGFFNAIQIVTVPEPSSLILVSLVGVPMLAAGAGRWIDRLRFTGFSSGKHQPFTRVMAEWCP